MGKQKNPRQGITFEESFLHNGGKRVGGEERSETISQFIPVIYPQTTANGSDDRDWPAANPTFDGISHVDVLDW